MRLRSAFSFNFRWLFLYTVAYLVSETDSVALFVKSGNEQRLVTKRLSRLPSSLRSCSIKTCNTWWYGGSTTKTTTCSLCSGDHMGIWFKHNQSHTKPHDFIFRRQTKAQQTQGTNTAHFRELNNQHSTTWLELRSQVQHVRKHIEPVPPTQGALQTTILCPLEVKFTWQVLRYVYTRSPNTFCPLWATQPQEVEQVVQ